MVQDECKKTTLLVLRLDAINQHDWRKVREIDQEIALLDMQIRDKSRAVDSLIGQLWPGARVSE